MPLEFKWDLYLHKLMQCNPVSVGPPGIFRCTECGSQNPRPTINGKPWRGQCQIGREETPPPNLTPLLTRLADLTNHPEIINQPEVYGRSVLQWAAGLIIYTPDGREADRIEPGEIRKEPEVEFIQGLCRENVCKKHHKGVCKPSCGPGMIVAVKARMASEGCPHRFRRW